jgi:hypothetical protein
MARLEGVLWQRIEEGLVERPASTRINSLSYWRNRLPAAGEANSRQIHELYDWWYKLQPYLPPDKRDKEYLRAIAGKATNHNVRSIPDLRAWQAGVVIEALKDRLRWALKDRSPEEAVADPAAPADPPAADPVLGTLDVTDDADDQVDVPAPAVPDVPAYVSAGTGPVDQVTAGGGPQTDEEVPF